MKTNLISCLLVILFASSFTANAQIYKSVNSKGQVVYSDRPPSTTSKAIQSPTLNSATTASSTAAANSAPKVKWHPGHYVMIYPQGTQSDASFSGYMDVVIQDVANNPAFQGIQKQYYWNKLEPAKGVYDFSEIKKDLAALAAVHKRLVISFEERSFITSEVFAPRYLLTSEYGGGVYSFNNGKGYNVNYWNDNVQNRLVALMTEMGKQLNANPNLEAINFEESSHGNNDDNWKKLYSTKYYNGVIKVALAARSAFPNTVVIQYINYADWNMDRLFATMSQAGIGVGGPDTSEKDVNLLNNSYKSIVNLSGTVPIGMAVQYLNYDYNNGVGPVSRPSVASIHAFAQNGLKANYIFWMRRTKETWNGSNYYQDVLNHMGILNWTSSPAGGLDTQCPTLLKVCNTN